MNEREYQKQVIIIYAEGSRQLDEATTWEEKMEVDRNVTARLENLAKEYYEGGYY